MKKLIALASFTFAFACSGAAPPMIADEDRDAAVERDAQRVAEEADPCATPAPGCPCADSGETFSCGLVYRISGSHVDCSPGSLTCQDDGGWSDCIGDSIWDGG